MQIKIFNSSTKQKEEFIPINKKNILMYVCGPTVYSYPHLGNARSVVIYDLLFRVLDSIFPKVTYVRNITDIDDKINKAAKDKNTSIQNLTEKFIKIFHQDMDAIGILRPTIEPKATEAIDEMIKMIQILIENNHAYVESGHVLFDVNSYKNYGKLSNRSLDDMVSGSRVEVQNYKRNPLDFVLWKPASNDDDISAIFDSPWGRGRPGWHIECSAMSNKFLGSDFDIHGGGADLKFPHHDNEIAQSICCYPSSKHAKYWVHNGFLTVNGEKMSKSLGNFITIRDLLKKDIEGVVIRYLLLSTHYRKPLDFNNKSLDDAKKAIDKFYNAIGDCESNIDSSEYNNKYLREIEAALCDDLNSPVAFSILHKIVKDIKKEKDLKQESILKQNLLDSLDFLGLKRVKIIKNNKEVDKDYIEEQIEVRKQAKIDRNWTLSDKIRDDLLENFNIILEDGQNGEMNWKIKK